MAERDPQTGAIIAAAFEVHNTLGHGFLEAVYREALCEELRLRGIPFLREQTVPVFYKGTRLACWYKADLICFGDLLVELKAMTALSEVDDAQVIHYLRGTGLERALLLNFGTPKVQIRRFILTAEYRAGIQQYAASQSQHFGAERESSRAPADK